MLKGSLCGLANSLRSMLKVRVCYDFTYVNYAWIVSIEVEDHFLR